jgi:outer membrane protein TolC
MWTNRNYLFLLLFISLNLRVTVGQEVLTLPEAIQAGLENNYRIRLAKKELELNAIDNTIGNAGFLPELSADGQYRRSRENTQLNFVDGTTINREDALTTVLNGGVGLNWFVFDGTRMFVTKNRLEELEQVAFLQLKQNINNELAKIITTYLQIIAEQQTLDLYAKQLEVSQERLKLSDARLEIGVSSELDNIQSKVDFNADRSRLMDQGVRLSRLKAQLNKLMGSPVDSSFQVISEITLDTSLQKENLIAALEQNPNLEIYQKNIEIALLEKKERFADRLPLIGLNGRYNYNESESEAGFVRSNETEGITYGATIQIPLFDGFEKRREEQKSKVRIEQSKIDYAELRAELMEQLVSNYAVYENNLELLDFELQNVELADKNLAFAMENYRLGGISAIDLREIQLSTLQARERLILTKYMAKVAETELLRLTHQLVQGI